MKYCFMLLLLSLGCWLSAANLISESMTGSLPAGWTQTGSASTHWAYNATTFSGGTAGELRFSWNPTESSTFRYISPAIDTRKVHDMVLSFRHMVDWYAGSYTLAVQISTNLSTWYTVWNSTAAGNIAANQVTANISYALGKSQTTYIAFTFIGQSGNIDYWYIDDIVLSYTNTLGSGTWIAGSIYPVGNVIIPNGETLTLNAGVSLYFAADTNLDVDGRLLVNGTPANYVRFNRTMAGYSWKGIDIESVNAANDSTLINYARIEGSYSCGIDINNSDKVRISHCEIYENKITGSYWGGGLRSQYSDIVLEYCNFYGNVSDLGAPGASFYYANPTVRYNVFYDHTLTINLGIVNFMECILDNVKYNKIVNNLFTGGSSAVYLSNCSGTFSYNLIANNGSHGLKINGNNTTAVNVNHCDVINNDGAGVYTTDIYFQILDTIVWGNSANEVFNVGYSYAGGIYDSCIQGGFASLTNIGSQYYANNIEGDPLFCSPTLGVGPTFNARTADWTLQDASPCIDEGYNSSVDPDGSWPDIGIYCRQLKPIISLAQDVTPDQGHQIDLRWVSSDMDTSWDPSAWYNVFRQAASRDGNDPTAVFVTDPRQITPDLVASKQEINWFDGTRTYTFLAQVKAFNFPDYSLIVPTLQDSTSTGLHAENYMVIYYNTARFSQSMTYSGYSVDNIPPYSARIVNLAKTGATSYNLSWDAVTEGVWEGNSYPETNLITYKVYASSIPNFTPSAANFVCSTTALSTVLNSQTASRRFYKIVASDSE
jgi:hypothetical protein